MKSGSTAKEYSAARAYGADMNWVKAVVRLPCSSTIRPTKVTESRLTKIGMPMSTMKSMTAKPLRPTMAWNSI